MILSIFLRRHLLHLHCGVDDTEDEDGCTDIERVDDGVGHNALGSHIADTEEGEEEREHVAYQ